MAENGRSASRSWLDRLALVLSGEPRDREELLRLLRDAERRDLFDADALAMIEGALQVADMQVRDIMVPRAEMVVVERDRSPEEFVTTVVESGHSRFPVVGESRDEVTGILLAKDLLSYFAATQRRGFDMRDVMRPAVFVPESKRLNVLLNDFRKSRNHMAMVVDEYGGVSGLVTIEDVLEQIVGEIDDEHDAADERFVKQLRSGEYLVKARTPIEEFNEYFQVTFDDGAFDTIGGLVVNALGHLPSRGEQCSFGGFSFTVLRADQRRVHLLRVSAPREASAAQATGGAGG